MIPVETALETEFGPLDAGTDAVDSDTFRNALYREVAYRMFLEGVSQVPEASVEFDTNRPLVGQSIRVYVPWQDSRTWRQVLDVERAVITKYPRSGLDVWISDYRPSDSEIGECDGT
jgi:hypothetical protein